MAVHDRHFDPARFERLLAPSRDDWARPAELIAQLDVRPGATWVDAGCGPGYFARFLAAALEPGTLVGLDDAAAMLTVGRERLSRLAQLRWIQAQMEHLPLASAAIDGVFCAFVWHEVPNRARAAREFARALRPGGSVALVDWRRIEPPPGPPLEHRLPPAALTDPLLAAGLRLESRPDFSSVFELVIARAD